MELLIDNFTAILPVTCNADCGFCPEKEMKEKEKKDVWVENLVKHLNATRHLGYDHVSLTGGEPSLDPRLLNSTLVNIHQRTDINKVGMTTNGQFLESPAKVKQFLGAIYHNGKCMLDFINISRHAFGTAENNDIMKVSYQHTLRDIINFRQLLPRDLSFRLNMVITDQTDIPRLFREAEVLYRALTDAYVGVAFRTDYDLVVARDKGLVPEKIMSEYVKVFGEVEEIGGCPTCISYQSPKRFNYFLKGANFEPTDKDNVWRELIQHQDGKLYYDWTRNKPVDLAEIGYIDPVALLGETTLPLTDVLTPANLPRAYGPQQLAGVINIDELDVLLNGSRSTTPLNAADNFILRATQQDDPHRIFISSPAGCGSFRSGSCGEPTTLNSRGCGGGGGCGGGHYTGQC